jgi:polysaccharide pyruvyl transferase WcaK-like protein
MKIVLAGDYGTSNLGDQGMLAVLRERLIERGDADITVLSRHPSQAYERLYRVRTLHDFRHSDPASRGRWFHGFNRGDSREHLVAMADAIREADMLVLGGGRLFHDYGSGFMNGDLAAYAQLVTLAHVLDTPVMLFAMTVVSEASEDAREYLRYIADGADLVTVREISSRANLVELGVERARVHVLPDPTLGLPFLEPDTSYGLRPGAEWLAEADELLCSLEVDRDQPITAINVRSYEWRDGEAGQRRTETNLAALLDRVARDAGTQFLFVPQRTYAGDDDRRMSRRVIDRMEERGRCRAIEDELNIWKALAIYQKVSALVSMRRNGLTFALTQHVPVASIAMDENTDFLTSTLGIAQDSVSLAPPRLQRSADTVARLVGSTPADHQSLFAHVDECAARTRAYVDLMYERVRRAR